MSRSRLEAVAAALLAITCCAGLPLAVAAGAGAALWFGGIALAVAVLAAAVTFVPLRTARRAALQVGRERV